MALATSSFVYPALIESNGEGGVIVSFRDIPEALTEAPIRDEVLDMAADALLTALEFYVESERAVPSPSVAKAGEVLVEVPPSAAAKVLLLNAMVESASARPSLPVGWASVAGKCIASRTFGIRQNRRRSQSAACARVPSRTLAREGVIRNRKRLTSARGSRESSEARAPVGLWTGSIWVDEPRWARRRIDLHLVKNPSLSVVQMENSESNFTIRQKIVKVKKTS